jgi:hypothetical protein
MRAFITPERELVLDRKGAPVADGWDSNDPTIFVSSSLMCAVCRVWVDNVREYKADHVAWHQRLEPSAGIE